METTQQPSGGQSGSLLARAIVLLKPDHAYLKMMGREAGSSDSPFLKSEATGGGQSLIRN